MNYIDQFEETLHQEDQAGLEAVMKQVEQETNPEEQVLFAQYLESIGYFSLAKGIYQILAPVYPEFYINLASIAGEDDQAEEAFGYLEQIPPTSDLYAAALVGKAELYQLEGLTDLAREKLAQAQTLTDDSLVVFGLAELDFELGAYEQAIKEYAQLDNRMIFQQTGVSTYQRIGLCYASLGRLELATEFLEKALELEYDDATLLEVAAILYEQEEYQKANTYFKQLDTMSPDYEGYEYLYAQSLHAEHRVEEALQIAKQGLSKNPFQTKLLLLASQFSYEMHQPEEAEQFLLQAMEDAEDLDEIVLRLTNLYLETERYEEILPFAQMEVDNVLARWNIARAFQQLEDDDKALDLYRELENDLKDNPEFLESYLQLLRQMGQNEKAKEIAGTYLKLVPDDLAVQDYLSDLEARQEY